MERSRGARRPAHPLPVRVMHWVDAGAIITMMLSGWEIYNASPSLPFTFRAGLRIEWTKKAGNH